jgi:uncharacterized protein
VNRSAQYVTMRDGVRIAVTCWVPASAEHTPVPAVVRATRYWRNRVPAAGVFDPAGGEAGAFTHAGFALVLVDVRGTGASFGVWDGPWGPAEVADLGEVAEWVAAQPWSTGRVGSHGVSYDGNTAELIAVPGAPSVRAIVPRFSDVDPFMHLSFPGGILLDSFVESWGTSNRALDHVDPAPVMALTGESRESVLERMGAPERVDADTDGTLLAKAIEEHHGNIDVWEVGRGLTFADDSAARALRVVESSPHHQRALIQRSGVAIQAWASWYDAGTAAGALSRFNNIDNPMEVLIGPWSHGGAFDAQIGGTEPRPAAMSRASQYGEIFRFLHTNLDTGAVGTRTRRIRYWHQFADEWRQTDTWPPAGTTTWTLLLAADGSLEAGSPAGPPAADVYDVDFAATTGPANRWATQSGGGAVIYPDRRDADERCLTYTSAPLEHDLDLVGDPVVTLHLQCSTPDAAVHAYLEAVTPGGSVLYLTEGQLRLIHRRTSPAPVGEWHPGPYRTFRGQDAAPVAEGEIADVSFALLPLAARLRAGWRVRLAVAGCDTGTFVRIPEHGTPTFRIHRSVTHVSRLELPLTTPSTRTTRTSQ